MGSVSQTLDRMIHALEDIGKTQSQIGKPNWGVIISAGSLLLAVTIALGTGFVGKPLHDLDQSFRKEVVSTAQHRNQLQVDLHASKERAALQNAKVDEKVAYLELRLKEQREQCAIGQTRITELEKQDVEINQRLKHIEQKLQAGDK